MVVTASCGEGVAGEGQNGSPRLWGFFWWRWRSENCDEAVAVEEFRVCGGYGETTTLEGNRGEHRLGDDDGNMLGQAGWLEDDRNGGAIAAGDGEEQQRGQSTTVAER